MAIDNPRAFVSKLSTGPGVYQMADSEGAVLYVGKARNLKKRVGSYFRESGLPARTQLLMSLVVHIETTITRTENEALLLESNLIKSARPRFNILLRDDKSYPYIHLSDHDYPRLAFHRGAKREKGRYFGPYPSSTAVRESLHLLQKVFPVRQCDDSIFRNRSRPCLQYQIKRCSAPCVGYLSQDEYAEDVRHAVMFLDGRSQDIISEMADRMEAASARLDFENAARYRDRIVALRQIQEKQYVSNGDDDADIIAIALDEQTSCVSVTFMRHGHHLGAKTFFPGLGSRASAAEILAAFLSQYYVDKPVPAAIYLSESCDDMEWLREMLTERAGHAVRLLVPQRSLPRRWIQLASLNAADALRRRHDARTSLLARFESIAEVFALDSIPDRIECFDISHTQGEATTAACVAFGQEGALKSGYRRYRIEDVTPGDDYAAIQQAVTRRFRHTNESDDAVVPDILLIDGGPGQLHAAEKAFEEIGVTPPLLVGVAKGAERKPGLERLFLSDQEVPTILPADSRALLLIQQVRDEAHRFAITGHRQRRARTRSQSTLEQIPGVGPRKRQALLRHFGGLRELSRAGLEEIGGVPGISPELARKIYDSFHEER
jgi:excinuclease ABC subunit C